MLPATVEVANVVPEKENDVIGESIPSTKKGKRLVRQDRGHKSIESISQACGGMFTIMLVWVFSFIF